MSEPEFAGSA